MLLTPVAHPSKATPAYRPVLHPSKMTNTWQFYAGTWTRAFRCWNPVREIMQHARS